MCGIFGYIGKEDASKNIISGLKRLEYRGYDSWGVAVSDNKEILTIKKTGAIGDIKNKDFGNGSGIGIGHTRWATHGGVSETNSHPHLSKNQSFAVAQNGIVENFQQLKEELIQKGHEFISETDTEVIVRQIEEKLKKAQDLREATRLAFLDLKGRNTIIVLDSQNNKILAIRNGSPLMIGIGENEYFVASDTLSFADKTNKILQVDNNEMIEIEKGKIQKFNAITGETLELKFEEVDLEQSKIDKEGFDHFMIKEIIEQKNTIKDATQYSQKELEPLLNALKSAETIYTVGAGTAYYAAAEIAYFFRKYAGFKAIALRSYESESYKELFTDQDLILAVSQSGETADTIESLEFAQQKGAKVASIVNMVGSTISKMSDFSYLSRSGPEICVASTKSFTAQLAWGLLITAGLQNKYTDMKKQIDRASKTLETWFNSDLIDQCSKLAHTLKNKNHFFILGKGQNSNIALEGALKVKEISYKHFEGFAAGELKHGVIALVEEGTPVFSIVSDDQNKDDMLSAASEVKSRGAFSIGIAKENNKLFDFCITTPNLEKLDPIANVIPFQILSYQLALLLGNDPDKPRNLAKSVTVK